MLLFVEQVMHDLYASDFVINRKGSEIGSMSFEGLVGSRDGHWIINFDDKQYELGHDIKIKMDIPASAYRPYQIYSKNCLIGSVFTDSIKKGVFAKYDVTKLQVNGNEYIMYPIGFGMEGAKNPIYCNDVQIALVEKDCIVCNEMYSYRIYSIDKHAAHIALLFCSYMYTCAGYKPGIKQISSIKKATTITTNKQIKAYFNPSFYSYVEE